jgi:hypothetical protein
MIKLLKEASIEKAYLCKRIIYSSIENASLIDDEAF